ncbi:MAG: hisS [Gammaproteobacteria bacterium]|nr:hisS [Gammaproteobacteria bacterium]
MTDRIQSIKGMHDILTDDTSRWRAVENRIIHILERYGYREIRFPVVEKTELFKRSIGEATDIVSKEMYSFTDQGDDSLTLRPEGTAGCVRAVLQNSLLQQNALRLWYMGPMFRREQPQKGRTRQFHQVGVEVFGLEGPDIDAEIILLSARIWRDLGVPGLVLQLNTLGTSVARQNYRRVLVDYFTANQDQLDADSRNRLQNNPLRILDSKNPAMQELIGNAPVMTDHLDPESSAHFSALQALLTGADIKFVVNPRLVRGLDYYNKTVFEWSTDRLGAQGTICAGGRYDGLVEHFGGKPTPAIGFALGLERLVELVGVVATHADGPDVYFIVAGEHAVAAGISLAERIRDQLPVRVVLHCGGGSFKSQFKKADKSGARLALILGEAEVKQEMIAIKPLRQDAPQVEVGWDGLIPALQLALGL